MITSNTTFGIYEYDPNDAVANTRENTIELGKNVMTIEILIHEINEIETSNIIKRFGFNYNARMKDIQHVTHKISPYGVASLLFPTNSFIPEALL